MNTSTLVLDPPYTRGLVATFNSGIPADEILPAALLVVHKQEPCSFCNATCELCMYTGVLRWPMYDFVDYERSRAVSCPMCSSWRWLRQASPGRDGKITLLCISCTIQERRVRCGCELWRDAEVRLAVLALKVMADT